jgi:DNA-directed RNA polymerase specialized sigma24 family protein
LKVEEAVELRRAGWTIQEIADHMGVTVGSASAFLTFGRQAGLQVPYADELPGRER